MARLVRGRNHNDSHAHTEVRMCEHKSLKNGGVLHTVEVTTVEILSASLQIQYMVFRQNGFPFPSPVFPSPDSLLWFLVKMSFQPRIPFSRVPPEPSGAAPGIGWIPAGRNWQHDAIKQPGGTSFCWGFPVLGAGFSFWGAGIKGSRKLKGTLLCSS